MPRATSRTRNAPRVASAELQLGRLAVDQEARSRGDGVGGLGAVAAPLLAGHEHQADAGLARRPQPLRRRDLRGENPLGVAGAAAVQDAVLDAAGEERRHAVEVRREDHLGLADRGDDVDRDSRSSGCSSTE